MALSIGQFFGVCWKSHQHPPGRNGGGRHEVQRVWDRDRRGNSCDVSTRLRDVCCRKQGVNFRGLYPSRNGGRLRAQHHPSRSHVLHHTEVILSKDRLWPRQQTPGYPPDNPTTEQVDHLTARQSPHRGNPITGRWAYGEAGRMIEALRAAFTIPAPIPRVPPVTNHVFVMMCSF